MELAQLFQDLEALVVQQEPAVTQIEQTGEQVTENVGKANVELDGAVVKARAARKKKWICLGLCGKSRLLEKKRIARLIEAQSSSSSLSSPSPSSRMNSQKINKRLQPTDRPLKADHRFYRNCVADSVPTLSFCFLRRVTCAFHLPVSSFLA